MTLRNRTMRDLITKLELVLFETALNPKNPQSDYAAKKKALHDLEMDPVANKDPEISKAIAQRKADLEKEASGLGVKETSVLEKAPEGWEGTVKAMKKRKEIDNPYALTNYMKNKGYKSHKKEGYVKPYGAVNEVFDGDKETGTTHKGGVVTKTSQGIKHTKTDYDDGGKDWERKEPRNRWHNDAILDKEDEVDEAHGSWDDEDFRNQERNAGLDQEPPNNFVVYINGKKWKVLPGRGTFADDQREKAQFRQLKDMCAKKTATTGKQWSVHLTGEAPT